MRKLLAVGLILALAAGVIGWWYAQHPQQQQDQLLLYGNVDIREVQLAFKTSDRIEHLYAREGQPVHAGELLASLEPARAQQSLRQAQAQAAAQAQQLAELEAGSRPEEIEQLQAELDADRAQAHNLELNMRRLQDLSRRKLASQEQLDNANAALDAANARSRAAAAALKLARIGPRTEQVERAKELLAAAEAQVALAQQTVDDTRLLAPVDGIVRDRMAEPGDLASPAKPVYSIALTDPVWVRTYIPEPDLGKLHPGQEVAVHTDSFPDKTYRAWVGYISPTAEFTPKSVQTPDVRSELVYQARVFVCNPVNELRLGMPATVTVPLGTEAADVGARADPCHHQ